VTIKAFVTKIGIGMVFEPDKKYLEKSLNFKGVFVDLFFL
jgi:hypothetical protein